MDLEDEEMQFNNSGMCAAPCWPVLRSIRNPADQGDHREMRDLPGGSGDVPAGDVLQPSRKEMS